MTGRNDPCPCGSGKKYKKCCLGTAEPEIPEDRFGLLAPPEEPLGGDPLASRIPYATETYLRSNPDSPIARMEALAREGDVAEERADPGKAYEIYRQVLAMAPDDKMKRTVLQDLEMVCMNSAEMRERGPEVSRELEEINLKLGDHGQAAQSAAERADFLEVLGRGEEAAAEYTRALAVYPRSPWLRIRYARFLAERGDRASAEAFYREALALPDEDRAHQAAREDLRAL